MNILKDGVYPAMLTPFDGKNRVDYGAVRELTEWYIEKGCQGVFATCLSSEIFDLSPEERFGISKTVVDTAGDRMDVVVSSHIEDDITAQLWMLKQMASLGAKSVVLIANRLAKQNESDDVLKENLSRILEEIPDTDFGVYECPHPYSRMLSPELMRWCADTGRINFMKDTCCYAKELAVKLDAVRGSNFKVYNANSVTLLDSVKNGAAGLCGVMANLHPDLYVKMLELARTDAEKAQRLQDILGTHSMMNYGIYPASVKYYLQLEGLNFKSVETRKNNICDISELPDSATMEMEQRFRHTEWIRQNLEYILK